jgi:hypothetical protein
MVFSISKYLKDSKASNMEFIEAFTAHEFVIID